MKKQQKPKLIEVVFPEDLESSETKNEIDKIKKLEERVNMILENFEQWDLMMRVFLTVFLKEADKKQGGFSNVLSIFNDKVTPRPKADKDKKKAIHVKVQSLLMKTENLTLNAFESGILKSKYLYHSRRWTFFRLSCVT